MLIKKPFSQKGDVRLNELLIYYEVFMLKKTGNFNHGTYKIIGTFLNCHLQQYDGLPSTYIWLISQFLTNRKRPLGSSPGGLEVCGLKSISNVSINKKHISLSQPVTNRKSPRSLDRVLSFSIDSEKDISGVKEIMENAIENLKVPFKVDIALGRSWGEAKE